MPGAGGRAVSRPARPASSHSSSRAQPLVLQGAQLRRPARAPPRGRWRCSAIARAAWLLVGQPVELPLEPGQLLAGRPRVAADGPPRRRATARARAARRPDRRRAQREVLLDAAGQVAQAPSPSSADRGRTRARGSSGRGETTTSVPGQPSSRSSSAVSVSMSRSLVGSSSSRTLGSSISRRSSCSRRRSPPDSSPTGVHCPSPANRDVRRSWPAVTLAGRRDRRPAGPPRPPRAPAGPTARARRPPARGSRPHRHAPLDPARGRRAARRRAAAAASSCPTPLRPTIPMRSPGPTRQVRSSSSTRRRAATRHVLDVVDVLPSRAVAKSLQLRPSRGGGSSAMSAFAASMRNRGFSCGRAAAAQPGELLAEQVRPARPRSPATRVRSARARTYAA